MMRPDIFMVYDCKKREPILITQSARKAKHELRTGIKIEVWNNDKHIETIYARMSRNIDKYVSLQKQYIGKKQVEAEQRNKRCNVNGK